MLAFGHADHSVYKLEYESVLVRSFRLAMLLGCTVGAAVLLPQTLPAQNSIRQLEGLPQRQLQSLLENQRLQPVAPPPKSELVLNALKRLEDAQFKAKLDQHLRAFDGDAPSNALGLRRAPGEMFSAAPPPISTILNLPVEPFSILCSTDEREQRKQQRSPNAYLAGTICLRSGAIRGKAVLPLWIGRLRDSGHRVLFVMTDASDYDFAKEFGTLHSSNLSQANEESVDRSSRLVGTMWEFGNTPGFVARSLNEGAEGSQDYSPLKRIDWRGRPVTVNISFVDWGPALGQRLVQDLGGCHESIRKSPIAEPYAGGGPAGCQDDAPLMPLDRFQGGQLLGIDSSACRLDDNPPNPCGHVVLKLHRVIHQFKELPFIVVLGSSSRQRAEQLGLPHIPKLEQIVKLLPNESEVPSNTVGEFVNVRNGIRQKRHGLDRFQLNVVSYGSSGPAVTRYTPILRIFDVYFDCDNDGQLTSADENRACPAVPVSVLGRPGVLDFSSYREQRTQIFRRGLGEPRIQYLNAPSLISVR